MKKKVGEKVKYSWTYKNTGQTAIREGVVARVIHSPGWSGYVVNDDIGHVIMVEDGQVVA